MPLPHDHATANLFIDGLAICCFTPGGQVGQWDVGFLRHHENHELILNIDGDANTPIRFDPNPGIVIHIETEKGISPFQQNPLGFFDQGPIAERTKGPTTLDAAENFRWTINLEEPPEDIGHGRGHLVKPSFPMTRAFIQNAVFYTQALSTKRLFRLLVSEDGTRMSQQELDEHLFGRTNNLIGADITCEPAGKINISIDFGNGPEPLGSFPHRNGNPWQISLTNTRPATTQLCDNDASKEGSRGLHSRDIRLTGATPGQGDFQLYYEAFDLDDDNQQRSLWAFAEPLRFISGRTDCNSVRVGTSTNLDELFK